MIEPEQTEPELLRQNRFLEEAFSYRKSIHRAAARILKDYSAADEVTQEVFLIAWKAYGRFQPGTNCRAWLYQILTYTIFRYRRAQNRFPTSMEGRAELLSTPPVISERLTDDRIIALLRRLPDSFRTVIVLIDLNDLSYKEAAERLRIPVGTVMSRLSRARHQMREMLLAGNKRGTRSAAAGPRAVADLGTKPRCEV